MQNGSSNENVIRKKTSNKEINILEWKYKQFLGEKLQYSNIQNQQENESFLLTKIRFTPDGSMGIVSDKGGRVIMFKTGQNKFMEYYYEFQAQEKDFDFHKSIEYSEEIKDFLILPSSKHNISIFRCCIISF